MLLVLESVGHSCCSDAETGTRVLRCCCCNLSEIGLVDVAWQCGHSLTAMLSAVGSSRCCCGCSLALALAVTSSTVRHVQADGWRSETCICCSVDAPTDTAQYQPPCVIQLSIWVMLVTCLPACVLGRSAAPCQHTLHTTWLAAATTPAFSPHSSLTPRHCQ